MEINYLTPYCYIIVGIKEKNKSKISVK